MLQKSHCNCDDILISLFKFKNVDFLYEIAIKNIILKQRCRTLTNSMDKCNITIKYSQRVSIPIHIHIRTKSKTRGSITRASIRRVKMARRPMII